jgi:molecular chaperone GrpE (heat shock protein)
MTTFHDAFRPFSEEEQEIAKWRAMQKTVEDAATQAEAKATAAKTALEKAQSRKSSTVPKLEMEYAGLSRMAEDARLSSEENRKRFESIEKPYAGKFTNRFVNVLNGFLDARIELSQKLAAASEGMVRAAEALQEFNDPKVNRLKGKVVDLERFELEEYGSVEPIDRSKFN